MMNGCWDMSKYIVVVHDLKGMASFLSYLLVIITIFHRTVNGEHQDCGSALGMSNRKITDKQISASHWLYFEEKYPNRHYVPQLARLNLKSASGAWCSESIDAYHNQYLQIDLLKNTKITAVATQGKYDSLEYTEAYQIMFLRDKENKARKYKEAEKWKVFKGNDDNKTIVRNTLKHPIIARKIRIYPRGKEFSIYCLRMELYGCKWGHRTSDIASYTAPLGAVITGIDTRDYDAYDGRISATKNIISGGLGKLTDDIYGKKYLASGDTSPWVAYNVKDPKITFEFHKKRLIKKVMIHMRNNGHSIQIFRDVLIKMGTGNGNFSLVKEYTSTPAQMNKLGALAIWIDLGEILTKYIQIQFIKRSEWLLISEILFISDDYPPRRVFPVPTVKNVAATVVYRTQSRNQEREDFLQNESPTKMGDSSKGLSFPIILTITLVTSALFIILTVVIYKTYVNKKTSHVDEPRDRVPSPQIPKVDKQAVSLLYDQPRMKFHPNTLLQHGMYMQSTPQAYNPKGVIS